MLRRLIQPPLFLVARCSRNELIRQIEWLNAENQILRAKLGKQRIFLSPPEKSRLLKLGKAIGSDLQHFIKIVSYQTFLRWRRLENKGHTPRKMGRPRTAESIRQLIVKIGTETRWGYTRIMGELKKMGLKPPSRNTVKRIMQAHELDPWPKGGPDSWQEFLERHAATLYQLPVPNPLRTKSRAISLRNSSRHRMLEFSEPGMVRRYRPQQVRTFERPFNRKLVASC